jgi:hypothetical protein
MPAVTVMVENIVYRGVMWAILGIAALTANASAQSNAANQSARSLSVVGGAATGRGALDFDLGGPYIGLSAAAQFRDLHWDVLRATATFPSRGGYVNLGTSLAYRSDAGFLIGGGGGISRFSFYQPFALVRFGAPLSIGGLPFTSEATGTWHWRNGRRGSALGLGLSVPLVPLL